MKQNYQLILDDTIKKLVETKKTPKLLLHACCAPCSSYVIEYLSKYFKITIYFYNPNMDTDKEYDRRSKELLKLVKEMKTTNKVDCIIEEYNKTDFTNATIGLELDPEGGERCFSCYNLRLRKAAEFAKQFGYDYFTTTLSISPYKNSFKLNEIGMKLEEELKVSYLQADFKKRNGYKRSIELSHEYKLYRQDYCGCIYSKRDHLLRLKEKEKLNKPDKTKSKLFIILLILLFIPLITVPTVSFSRNIVSTITCVSTEEDLASINEFYIYGTHLNIKGNLNLEELTFDKVSLYFEGRNSFYTDVIYNTNNGTINFTLADKINEGFSLENLKNGDYKIYLAVQVKEDIKYYRLDNTTDYKNTTYYTMSKKNQEIKFKNNKTLIMEVDDTKKESLDIVIDPGHGGDDPGACFNNKCEVDYTLKLSNLLRDELISKGYKVGLTRESNETLESYGKKSRTGQIYENNAKFVVSIHLNAGPKYEGYEIYTPYNVNYVFANTLKNNLDKIGAKISPNTFNKVSDGIYTRTMNQGDLDHFVEHAKEHGYDKYEATPETNYYYMIRETGGYMTGAYTDGRFDEDGDNPYLYSNVGAESYITELGYITSLKDMEHIDNNMDKYITQLSSTIDDYLK